MEAELGFPRLNAEIHFFSGREGLRGALLSEGHASATAESAVAVMSGMSSAGIVRIDTNAMYRLSWPARIWVLAHELAHVVQYQLSGGRRGSSEQWLREGMAEWVGMAVLERLGRGRVAAGVRKARESLRSRSTTPVPALCSLVPPESWLGPAADNRRLYDYALVAAADLVKSHGLSSLVAYFRRFATSDDRTANFTLSFSESPEAFEARLDASVRR
jgi:hypothetical protein